MVRRYAKNQRKRRLRSSKPRVSFKTKVIAALASVSEKKVAKLFANNITIGPSMITANQLMPNIRQGTKAHAERIGNKILLKKLTIKGWIQIPSTESVAGDTQHLSRMFILRQRNMNASAVLSGTGTLFDENNLMEYDQPYLGTPNNWLQSVNETSFVSRRDVKKTYSVSSNFQGSSPEVPQPDSIRFFSITLTFGKGKTLLYKDDAAFETENFPYFLTCAIHQPDGTATAGNPKLQYYTEAHYTDI